MILNYMTGKQEQNEIVGSSCPISLSNNPSSFDDPLVQRKDDKESWNILQENNKSHRGVVIISPGFHRGRNYYQDDNLQNK